MAVLYLPSLPPFPGHVSQIHAVRTIGACVDALQLRHADFVGRVYGLRGMIECTFVRVPLYVVRQNVLSLRWQAMMLSQLQCGTKVDHLKLRNMIRDVQQGTGHHLPLCVHMKIHYEVMKYVYGQRYNSWNFQLHWSSLPLIYGLWRTYNHMITIPYHNFMPMISLIERIHTDFKEGAEYQQR